MDAARFHEAIEAAIPSVRRFARALTRDPDTADDLLQDTLVRALRSRHLFSEGSVRAWLFAILLNLNRNRLRGISRRPVLTELDDDAGQPITGGQRLGAAEIDRALELLPEEQRTALLLVVLEGLSYREVATAQNVPIGTVMSRIARARSALRVSLEEERPVLRRIK